MITRTNEEWLSSLRATGVKQAAAITDLREILLRGALYSLKYTRYDLSHLGRNDVLQLAEDSAQEALLSVLDHLSDFRGDSKFTTWAYKFSINLSLVSARRESWKRVSLDDMLESTDLPESPFPDPSPQSDPERALWRLHVWDTVREVIEQELTDRQRRVLKAMVFDEVPMDEVARHFNTNRNTIYKLVHDARRKLKLKLEVRGLTVGEIMDTAAGR